MQNKEQKGKLIFGYWGIRGLGQKIRYLLEITETQYDEKRYTSFEEWFDKDKKNLGLDFPNLPYIIDGDYKLTESQAVARYVINRSGKTELLGGQDPQKRATVEMLQNLATEVFKEVAGLVYNQDFEKVKDSFYTEKLVPKLQNLEKYLGDKKFLTGNQVTLPDIWLYEVLTQISLIYSEQFKAFEHLNTLVKNVEEIPQMKAYLASEKYVKAPYNSDAHGAKWNNN